VGIVAALTKGTLTVPAASAPADQRVRLRGEAIGGRGATDHLGARAEPDAGQLLLPALEQTVGDPEIVGHLGDTPAAADQRPS